MTIETEPSTRNDAAELRTPGCVEAPPGFTLLSHAEAEQSIASRFAEAARRHGGRIAVKYGGQVITYRELDLLSNRLARTLLARCGPGPEPIALLLDKGIPFFTACLGVWKAGKFVVPFDPRHPRARIAFIRDEVQARYLFTDTANETLGESIAGAGALNVETLELDQCDNALDLDIDPKTPASILYTSGSTGRPKGVLQLQRNLLWSATNYVNSHKLHVDDRVTLVSSLSVVSAYTAFVGALLSGASIFPRNISHGDLEGLAAWMQMEGITFMQCVPSLFRHLAAAIPPEMTFPHLRVLVLGGELCTPGDVRLFQQHFGCAALVNYYGFTECTPVRHHAVRDDESAGGLYLPIGYPMPGMHVRILGPDGDELPPGEIGEIVLSSRYLAAGYWRNPEAMARAFRVDSEDPELRHYYTGDLGSLQADGCLTCHGRLDFQTKIRGFRVETGEVEQALLDLPAVKEAVVTARDDARGEQCLTAYLVPNRDDRPETGEVLTRLRERLPDYMIPAAIVWLAEMPLTPTGKIDRLALPAPVFDESAAASDPPCTPLEEELARIWAEVLGLDCVGRRESFYDLGGHSLLAPRLFSLIEERVGRRLPLATLLQASSVADMAALLNREDWTPPWSSLAPIQPGGSRLPFICVHPAGGDILVFRELSRLLGPDQPFYGLQENQEEAGNVRDTVEEMADHYLRQLRDFQPDGPYLLGGYSFGGVVAFEMARQLTAQGAEVGLLVLFDTNCPIRLPQASVKKYRRMSLPAYLRSRPAWLARACQRLFIFTLFNACRLIRCPFPARFRKAGKFLFYRLASKRYRPARYPGGLTLFRVTGSRVQGDLGWGEQVDGPVEIRSVPGYHDDMFSTENVGALAAQLRDCLRRTQDGEDNG
jgi:amino acid adenylation domain-containing protein